MFLDRFTLRNRCFGGSEKSKFSRPPRRPSPNLESKKYLETRGVTSRGVCVPGYTFDIFIAFLRAHLEPALVCSQPIDVPFLQVHRVFFLVNQLPIFRDTSPETRIQQETAKWFKFCTFGGLINPPRIYSEKRSVGAKNEGT